MRLNRVICLSILFVLCFSLAAAPAKALDGSGDASIQNGCNSIDGQVPSCGSDPALGTALSTMLYEMNTDTIVYSRNPDAQVPPAALVKIMTALVVLDHADISETLTVTESALNTVPKLYQSLSLVPGEQFTVDQMLYAIVVASSHDAAAVLAEHVAGSQSEFVRMMNEKAAELGCTGTHFVNVHGLSEEEQLTTARDVTKMLQAGYSDPRFMEYFGTMSYRIAATEYSDIRRVESSNLLMSYKSELYYDKRVIGGRIGIIDDQRRSVAAIAENNKFRYILVVLGAEMTYRPGTDIITQFGNYEEAKQLLRLGFDQSDIYQVLYDGQGLASYSVIDGDSMVLLGPAKEESVVLPKGLSFEDLTMRLGVSNGSITAPLEKGEEVTDIQLWFGNVCIAQSPVVTLNSVRHVGAVRQLENTKVTIDLMKVLGTMLTVVLIIGALLLVTFLVLRSVGLWRKVKLMVRHRRRRSGRRRTR